MRRSALPDELPEPFTVAEARVLGVSRGRTRAQDLVAPFHSVRLPAAFADDHLLRLRALHRVTPAAAFSHQTAASLWRLPLPAPVARDTRIHQTVPSDRHRVEHRGVVGHVADRRITRLSNGLPVTELGETWCDLAPQLTLAQLVQAGDAILNRETWDAERLAAQVERARGRRGVRTLRAALPLLRPGSASPRESECRVLFDAWGLPEPELNADLYNASGWLACVDFLWRDQRVVAEYYGKVHGPTWEEDLTRAALIEDEDYDVVVITDSDLARRRDALHERLARLLC